MRPEEDREAIDAALIGSGVDRVFKSGEAFGKFYRAGLRQRSRSLW